MKIFCIGLPRTGTRSFIRACEILGYRGAHFDAMYHTRQLGRVSIASDKFVHEPGYDKFNAFADFPIPIPVVYKGLAKHYPDSLFVLLQRDVDDWIKSWRRLPGGDARDDSDYRNTHREYRKKMFGYARCDDSVNNVFVAAYRRHASGVEMHFNAIGKHRLFVWDLAANPSWKPLCEFVGKSEPAESFPHLNNSREQDLRKRRY